MLTKPNMSPRPAPRVTSDSTAIDGFADVRGGVIDTFNDTNQKYKGKQFLPLFARKLEGYSIINKIDSVSAPTRGAAMWIDPDTSAQNRFHKVWAAKDKIYLTDESGTIELRDVDADGYSIVRLVGAMAKNNLYIVIGDSGMDSKVYKYIGSNSSSAACTDGGAGEVNVESTEHGLVVGMTVTISGTTDYDGDVVVTDVTDNDNFKFSDTYTSDQAGEFSVSKQIGLQTMTGMRAASHVMYWEQRLAVTGVGSNQSLPQYSEINISGNFNNFVVDTTTDGAGDFYGNLGGITCMIEHAGYGVLAETQKMTVHSIGAPIPAGTSYIRDPDTLRENLTVSGFGTRSPFGVVSARGAVYYIDPSSGVFELVISTTVSGFSKKNKDLTETWKSEFLKYDTRDACVTYDSVQDLLLVSGVSTADGGASDIVLIYSFRTGRWSSDPGKRSRQIIASPDEKKLYGFGSTDPEIQHFFDGSYNDAGEEKQLFAWTRMYDAGRRSVYKELENTTVIIGIHPEVTSMLFEIVLGDGSVATDANVNLADFAGSVKRAVPGEWADYQFGYGSFDIESDFVFRQYYNWDYVDNFQRMSVRLTETSNYPCLFYIPEVVTIISDDFAEDIY